MSEKNSRWDEIRKIQIESATAYRIFGGLVLVGIGVLLGSHFFAGDSGYGTNLYTEFISIAATVFIIDILNSRRDERRREQELKDRLLREVRSPEGIIARHAFHELQERDLMYGQASVLRRANMRGAKPRNVDLGKANLDGANLSESDFCDSSFMEANLDNTDFFWARLTNAVFQSASLRNANLQAANLKDACLICADLEGADLMDAKLESAQLYTRATFSVKGTREDGSVVFEDEGQLILPDGTKATPTTDISRFTDKRHPKFWRSSDPGSPAYKGK